MVNTVQGNPERASKDYGGKDLWNRWVLR